jgi:transposase-like protein
MQKRVHSRELKLEIVRQVATGQKRPAQVCREYGLAESVLSRWRKEYRNGSYTRDLVTKTGRIEDLSVPRDRAGQFHTQMFERYGRYEPEVCYRVDENVCQWHEYP